MPPQLRNGVSGDAIARVLRQRQPFTAKAHLAERMAESKAKQLRAGHVPYRDPPTNAVSTKRTPIRLLFRHTTWQRRFIFSGIETSVNLSGMPTGFSTSRRAPVADIFRITQSMPASPLNLIEPPFNVRSRWLRFCCCSISSVLVFSSR